jgi:hypothetical protein
MEDIVETVRVALKDRLDRNLDGREQKELYTPQRAAP